MNSHVSIEISRLRETKMAEFALIRLLARVNTQMLRQRARVGKGLFAEATPIRPLARMRPHMRGHAAALRELSIADGAMKRFFSAVRSAMRR